MNAILMGIATGLGLSLSTGPIFFTLLQTAIQQGFRKAIFFILGVSFADTTMIMLTRFGLNQVDGNSGHSIIGLLGGILLIGFGTSFIMKRNKNTDGIDSDSSTTSGLKVYKLFVKGLSINILNPIVWAFWAAISKYTLTTFPESINQILFLGAILFTVFCTDLLKAHFSRKLVPFLRSNHLKYLSVGIGVLLIVFGSKLIWDYSSVINY